VSSRRDFTLVISVRMCSFTDLCSCFAKYFDIVSLCGLQLEIFFDFSMKVNKVFEFSETDML